MKSILKRVLAIGASFIMVVGITVESASSAFAWGADVGTIGNGYAKVYNANPTTIAAVTVCHSETGYYTAALHYRARVVIGSSTASGPTLYVLTWLDSTVSASAHGVQNGNWACQKVN